MGVRHLVGGAILCAVIGGSSAPVGAQDADRWRVHFAAGEEARQAADHERYAEEMAAAADALPVGRLNRPFVQYHAARAAALLGREADAVRWLTLAWEEDIEALMISFAPHDPAFEGIVESESFVELMGRASRMELGVRHLGGRVHLITGTGSNIVAHVASDGVFLVDTGYGPALPALRAAVSSLSAASVTGLVVTHPHEDHMGSAEALGADARVYAHPGTAAAMKEPYAFMDGVEVPPKGEAALPDVAVERDTTIVVGGEAVRIFPTVAHTAGDLSVYFTESNVAHLGDAYLAGNPMMFPGQDDPEAFLDAFDGFLDEMNDLTVVVGGHEDVADVAAVRAQIDVSRACIAFVKGELEGGATLQEAARRGADRFPPQWVAFFYGVYTQRGG